MRIEELMKRHGFRLAASCAGTAWYTKFVDYQGKRAYITVTSAAADDVPSSPDEPVLVTVYDLKSGEELQGPRRLASLASYLEAEHPVGKQE